MRRRGEVSGKRSRTLRAMNDEIIKNESIANDNEGRRGIFILSSKEETPAICTCHAIKTVSR